MEDLTVTVDEGIEKGLVISEDRWDLYKSTLDTTKEIAAFGGDSVLYLSTNTWYYLQDNRQNASYSAWLSGVEVYTVDRLQVYYDINPDKLPDVVYVEEQYPDVAERFCTLFSYKMAPISSGYVLLPQ